MTSPNLIINSVRRSNIKDASTVFGRFLIYEFLPSARLKKCFFVTRLFYFTTFFTLCASFPLLLAFCWHNFSTRPLPGHAVSNKCGNTLIETALNLSNYKCLYEPLSPCHRCLCSMLHLSLFWSATSGGKFENLQPWRRQTVYYKCNGRLI